MKKRVLSIIMSACLVMIAFSGCSSSSDEIDVSNDGEVTLADYSNLEVYEAEAEVTDEDWEETLSSMLSSAATTEQVTEGTVEEGDSINIDYVGTIYDDYEFDGGTASATDITVGSSGYIDGFDDGLIGAEIGSTVELNLTFPDDYTYTTTDEDGEEIELAGLDVTFAVTINYRTDTITPEFDDDFVVDNYGFYGYTTAEDFEEFVREEMRISNIINVIWDDYVESCTVVSYDQDEVDSYVAVIESYYESQYQSYYGVDIDTYLAAAGVDEEEWNEANIETAQENLKEKMVYYAIAEAEGLVPSQEEYEEEAQLYVDANGLDSLEDLEEAYTKDEVVYAIITERVQEFLAENVNILDGERPEEESSSDTTEETTADESDDAEETEEE